MCSLYLHVCARLHIYMYVQSSFLHKRATHSYICGFFFPYVCALLMYCRRTLYSCGCALLIHMYVRSLLICMCTLCSCVCALFVHRWIAHTYKCEAAQVNPKSTSNQSSKPCTVLQYTSKKYVHSSFIDTIWWKRFVRLYAPKRIWLFCKEAHTNRAYIYIYMYIHTHICVYIYKYI